jgi:hypothetical protein
MKKMFTSFALLVLTSTAALAQDPAMEASLTDAVTLVDTATTMPTMMNATAKFDLIAGKYTDQWIAQYYAAYSKAILSYYEPDMIKKDLILDEADAYLANITAMNVSNEHIFVLKALLANARMAVDGQNRWQKYSPIFDENLKKAKELNENNPEIYYLKGTSVFYTPKMFGGGGKKAKPYFEKAKERFAMLKDKSALNPHWGEFQTTFYLNMIAEGKDADDMMKK